MRNHSWILAGIFWHNGKFPWEMECLLNPFHFFGGVYISHHFPSDFHSSWDFLPAAVACRAGQIHTERRAPFVGHPSDLSGLSWVILDQLGHKWTSIQANINLSLVFFVFHPQAWCTHQRNHDRNERFIWYIYVTLKCRDVTFDA